MTNSVGAPVAGASRKEALDVYLSFYRSTWAGGNRKVCKDAQVTAQARQVLTESEAEHRFSLLPFYPCVMEMMESRNGGPQVLLRLIRAAEILEMFCMNLLVFPWKKEFRTLKKFTGNFVYYVQPALPNQITRNILCQIGYDSENDSEYRLSENVDLNAVTQMGFELFLVRLECEHLLELLDQKSDAEGLEIIRKRAAFLQSAKTAVEGPGRDAYRAGGGVLEEDGQRKDDLPPNPDPSPIQSLKPEVLDIKEPPKNSAEGGQRGFICEDKSIMEMQESYPDLAFRQKPIFQNVNPKRKPDRRKDVQTKVLSNDMSGPQGIALHADLPRKLQIPECSIEQKQPALLRNKQALKTAKNNDDPLNELAEKLDRLKLKEADPKEPLKYPIEETVLPQAQTQHKRNEPIVCSLSQESVCNISDCSSCPVTARLQTNDGITEPPHSIYIPNCQDCRSGPAPPVEHDENNRIREPEENLDQTYTGGI